MILGINHAGSVFAVKGLSKAAAVARDEVEQVRCARSLAMGTHILVLRDRLSI